jgi:NitT/TauT family transport system substrate-binding protein
MRLHVNRRRAVLTAACCLCAVVLSMGPRSAQSQSVPIIHVGTSNNVGAAIVYLAQDRGYFQRAGLDVDIQPVANGSAAATAVVSGALDVAEGNVISIALAHENGLPLEFMAPVGNYSTRRPTTVLVVDRTSPITTAAALNGKTVAVNGLNNITQLAAEGWVDQHGGDSKTLHFVELTFGQMASALQRHAIDAAVVSEPALTETLVTGRVLGQCYDAIGKNFMVTGWFATSDWISKHADAITRFRSGLAEAAKWANASPQETDAILANRTGIQMDLIKRMARADYATKFEAAMIQPQIDIAEKYGVIKTHVDAREIMQGAER